jgi:hypothetical protein
MSINRIKTVSWGTIFLVFILAPVSAFGIVVGGVSEPNGVYCEINKVKLFALSAEDCKKAGGTVTHTVTTTVKPADNAAKPKM